jgi:thymidylate synthase (FAD)
MEVEVLRATENPERLVCQAARGDYFEGYVGDTSYSKLMADVEYDEEYIDEAEDTVLERWNHSSPEDNAKTIDLEEQAILEAKTKAFCEKQLSRGHYGPWEHPQITFAVKGVSRVTMAQITRHRHMTFDIQSMRYADFSEQEIVTPKSLTDDGHLSREKGLTELDDATQEFLRVEYDDTVDELVDLYERMVERGVPKEDARFILPLGTTVNMTFSGNSRTFLHLLDMRKKANAQWEIRELSEALLDELFDWCPYTFDWYERNGPNKLSP